MPALFDETHHFYSNRGFRTTQLRSSGPRRRLPHRSIHSYAVIPWNACSCIGANNLVVDHQRLWIDIMLGLNCVLDCDRGFCRHGTPLRRGCCGAGRAKAKHKQ